MKSWSYHNFLDAIFQWNEVLWWRCWEYFHPTLENGRECCAPIRSWNLHVRIFFFPFMLIFWFWVNFRNSLIRNFKDKLLPHYVEIWRKNTIRSTSKTRGPKLIFFAYCEIGRKFYSYEKLLMFLLFHVNSTLFSGTSISWRCAYNGC